MKYKTQRKLKKQQEKNQKSQTYKDLLNGCLKIMKLTIDAVGLPQHVETRKDRENKEKTNG